MKITKEQVLNNIEDVKKYINEIDNKKETEEKKFEIKNRFTGDVIYSSSKTTYKDVVEEAVRNEANLYEADLSGADLYEADLSGADLYEANLYEANLYGANLREADLSGADLYEANLYEANLYGANLREAEMHNAKFYGKGGTTKIKKSQVEDFFKALGIIVED